MSGDFIQDFASEIAWLISFYQFTGFFLGLIAGFFLVVSAARYFREKESWEIYLATFVMSALVPVFVHGILPFLVKKHFGDISVSGVYLLVWFVGFFIGGFLAFIFFRKLSPAITKWEEGVNRRTDLAADKKTDVRTVKDQLPSTPDIYNVMDYYKPGFICIGLDKDGEPVYVSFDVWRSNHIQLTGTTGAGKGVAAQMCLVQAALEGEAVFVFDPKDDEWLPHVLEDAANQAGVPYHYINLREGEGAQINPLAGVNSADLKELLIAAFGFSDKGTDADHYRLGDRKLAAKAAKLLSTMANPTFRRTLSMIQSLDGAAEGKGFLGKYEEMAELDAVNACEPGIDFAEVINQGGIVYLVGSMRHEVVKCALRFLMVRLVQVCDQRDRLVEQRSVCVFLDELKYHLSKPAMEIFGAARDKGLHALVAHQSLSDLRDVPADLDADAVVGSVIENTALKIIYKLQDPDTAEWIARRSGIKLVDEELRSVNRNIAHSEIIDDDRTLRQGETYLVDTNMLQNLPSRVAVLFSEDLPQFVGTSPFPTDKRASAIVTDVIDEPVLEEEPAPTPIPSITAKPVNEDEAALNLLDDENDD